MCVYTARTPYVHPDWRFFHRARNCHYNCRPERANAHSHHLSPYTPPHAPPSPVGGLLTAGGPTVIDLGCTPTKCISVLPKIDDGGGLSEYHAKLKVNERRSTRPHHNHVNSCRWLDKGYCDLEPCQKSSRQDESQATSQTRPWSSLGKSEGKMRGDFNISQTGS